MVSRDVAAATISFRKYMTIINCVKQLICSKMKDELLKSVSHQVFVLKPLGKYGANVSITNNGTGTVLRRILDLRQVLVQARNCEGE